MLSQPAGSDGIVADPSFHDQMNIMSPAACVPRVTESEAADAELIREIVTS
jgi:hypothetical protein